MSWVRSVLGPGDCQEVCACVDQQWVLLQKPCTVQCCCHEGSKAVLSGVIECGPGWTFDDRENLERSARLALDGILAPVITAVHPLADAPAALAAVENGHTSGKVVIEVT